MMSRKVFGMTVLLCWAMLAEGTQDPRTLHIGWAEADLTPEERVVIAGQFHVRVSEGVRDPVIATVLAMESHMDAAAPSQVIMISCDLISITDDIRDGVRELIRKELPEVNPEAILLYATHTHTAPYHYATKRFGSEGTSIAASWGVELPGVMSGEAYVHFAARRIADAVKEAWAGRETGGIAYGLGHAVVGRNRLMVYRNGRAVLYGGTGTPDFSHVEGYEDPSVNLLATYRSDGSLSGLIINIASPAQAEGGARRVSADFWHEGREELRRRLGDGVFISPQVSSAGDHAPRPQVAWRAERRMARLEGHDWRQELANRIADAVDQVLPVIAEVVDWNPVLTHHSEQVDLPRRLLDESDVEEALRASAPHRARYEALKTHYDAIPMEEREPRWYEEISMAFRHAGRGDLVAARFEEQQVNPDLTVELHAVRLGDVGFVSNPFELYLDYGMRIKARSPAMQTFVVQLAGSGTYVPTARSIIGGGYGAVPASTEVGVEGGEKLVDWSVDTLRRLWHPGPRTVARLRAPLNMDGDLTSWEGVPSHTLAADGVPGGKLYLAWDDEHLYLAAVVEDAAHYNARSGLHIWDGDCLQFALLPEGKASRAFNLGLALTETGVQGHQWRGADTGLFEQSEYAVVHDPYAGKTMYEIKIPFEALTMAGEEGEVFRFNAVVFNDDDGAGYHDWVELFPGIVGGWGPDLFADFVLAE